MPNAVDLTLYQGDDWGANVVVSNPDLTAADLTGYTAQAQIRTGPADQQLTVAAEIQATVQLPNQVLLYLSHDQTTVLTGALYYWDLQLTSGAGQIVTVLAGKVKMTQEVTREVAGAARIRRIA